VPCQTANVLFEKYAKATIEYFEAADKLSNLTGQHADFLEAKKHATGTRADCRAARLALEQHWEEHGCRSSAQGTKPSVT
jgi:hypothetical protein